MMQVYCSYTLLVILLIALLTLIEVVCTLALPAVHLSNGSLFYA